MDKKILIAGGIGGMAVPVLRAALKLTQQIEISIDLTAAYAGGTVLLAAVGMATVWFLDETERRKAFVIGLSLPATISSLGGQVKTGSESAAILRLFTAPIAMFMTTARAAEPAVSPPPAAMSPNAAQSFVRGRQFRVVGTVKGGVTVQFVDKDGNELDEYVPAGTKTRNLPDAAMTAIVGSPSGARQKIDLGEKAGSVTVATVEVEQERTLGFWQALGVPSALKETLKTTAKVDSVRERGQVLWIKRDTETPARTMSLAGGSGTAKAYIFARKDLNAAFSDGMLLPGDKFAVLEASDPTGRWMKIKVTEIAATPRPSTQSPP